VPGDLVEERCYVVGIVQAQGEFDDDVAVFEAGFLEAARYD